MCELAQDVDADCPIAFPSPQAESEVVAVDIQPDGALTFALVWLTRSVGCALVVIGLRRVIRRRLRCFPGQWYEISVPSIADDTRLLFDALHELLRGQLTRLSKGQPPVALSLHSEEGNVSFRAWLSESDQTRLKAIFRAVYPGAELNFLDRVSSDGLLVVASSRARVRHRRSTVVLPESTGLAALMDVLGQVKAGQELSIEVLLRPAAVSWWRRLRSVAAPATEESPPWVVIDHGPAGREPIRASHATDRVASEFDVDIRLLASAASFASAQRLVAAAAVAVTRQSGESLTLDFGCASRYRQSEDSRRFPLFVGSRLTSHDLASFWRAGSAPSLEAAALLAAARGYRMPTSERGDDDGDPPGASCWRPLSPGDAAEVVGIGRRVS
jgi:hypothetical protein